MRAHIPNPPQTGHPSSLQLELTGPHLRAMKEISAFLMDKLPAGDYLWQALGGAESLLMEAQMQNVPPREVFGAGGVAGFCQSVVDEYHTRFPNGASEAGHIPASRDRSVRSKRPSVPRDSHIYRRKKRATVVMVVTFSLLFVLLACWYIGLIRYIVDPTGFYMDEIHNFEHTATALVDAPLTLTLPLSEDNGIHKDFFTASTGETIEITSLLTEVHKLYTPIEEESGASESESYQEKSYIKWKLRFTYPIDASFTKVSYIEPNIHGTATVELADGTEHIFPLRIDTSGTLDGGYEYIYMIVADFPKELNTQGATLRVEMDPPNRIVWKRTGVGGR